METNSGKHIEVDVSKIDPERARKRAEAEIENSIIPEAGQRNETAFKLAARLKDCGVDLDVCLELMHEWNIEYLDDPLESSEIDTLVNSCYKTGQNAVGVCAVEALFDPIEDKEDDAEDKENLHPIDKMNTEFALCLSGGSHHILWETKDVNNNFELKHLNEQSFHKFNSHRLMEVTTNKGKKLEPLSKLWLTSKKCRRYKGLVFQPGKNVSNEFYNLWRGFAMKPRPYNLADTQSQRGFENLVEHTFENICRQDQEHFDYLMDYAAHMIKKPMEKPSVAIVFSGRKGVGKTVWLEALFRLVKPHSLIVDNRRFLIGNFNSHLEGKLALGLDEAFWAGDKPLEGMLKGLITGHELMIERKGIEPYPVNNIMRLFFLSNEYWVIPASEDERRFFALSIGEQRMRDTTFFGNMVDGLKGGGDEIFLDYLLNRDISNFNPHYAPSTDALTEQKIASLGLVEQWWFSSIREGELIGATVPVVEFEKIHTAVFKSAFANYIKQHHVRARLPSEQQIGTIMSRIAPSVVKIRERSDYFYLTGGLDVLRHDFEKYLGTKIQWPEFNLKGDLACLN